MMNINWWGLHISLCGLFITTMKQVILLVFTLLEQLPKQNTIMKCWLNLVQYESTFISVVENEKLHVADLQTKLDSVTVDFGKMVANLKMTEEVR